MSHALPLRPLGHDMKALLHGLARRQAARLCPESVQVDGTCRVAVDETFQPALLMSQSHVLNVL